MRTDKTIKPWEYDYPDHDSVTREVRQYGGMALEIVTIKGPIYGGTALPGGFCENQQMEV